MKQLPEIKKIKKDLTQKISIIESNLWQMQNLAEDLDETLEKVRDARVKKPTAAEIKQDVKYINIMIAVSNFQEELDTLLYNFYNAIEKIK